jgi:hypothetical protein
MADPIILSAAAIATLVATKALEKIGGTLSDKLWSQAEMFIVALRKSVLRDKSDRIKAQL